jgi:hypothetical protein
MSNIDYLTNISLQSNNGLPTIIYTSIGCGAHSTDDYYECSEQSRNHEYPLFLRKMRQKYGKFNLHMFLIDPNLEKDTPYVCQNIPESNLTFDWLSNDNIKYINKTENITVYALREYAYHRGSEFGQNYKENTYINFIDKLNELSIKYNWTTFVFNHCGEYFSIAPTFYQQDLGSHCDHIIYGYFVSDEISSCGINTSIPECDFITYIHHGKITVFNPYLHAKNFNITLPRDIENMTDEQRKIALKQFNDTIIIKVKININNILSALRMLSNCQKNNTKLPDYTNNLIVNLQKNFTISYNKETQITSYCIVYNELLNILREFLYKYLYLRYFEDTKLIIEEIIIVMQNEKDIYKWSSIVDSFLFSYAEL